MRGNCIALFSALMALAGCSQRRDVIRYPATPSGPPPIQTNSSEAGLIPAGTIIEVRTNEAINEESAAEGRTYSAELVRDIVGNGGRVLAPCGSPAKLVVLEVHEGGKIAGDRVQLGLQSITVNGRDYMVESGAH